MRSSQRNDLVGGAHAVAFYAEPRSTKDLDVWIIGRAESIRNKAAGARPQDLLELAMLEQHG